MPPHPPLGREAYRIRLHDLLAASKFDAREPDWFYQYRVCERESTQKLRARLVNAKVVTTLSCHVVSRLGSGARAATRGVRSAIRHRTDPEVRLVSVTPGRRKSLAHTPLVGIGL